MRVIVFMIAALPLLSPAAFAATSTFHKPDATQRQGKSNLQEKPLVSPREPVMLTADQVDYDQENDIVSASGNVEVIQGETIVMADELLYDRQENIVRARGHVSMLAPSGDVYFADALDLQDDLKAGVVAQFKARLSDNSLFVAASGRKLDENRTELFKAAYTPCHCVDDYNRPRSPTWQIRADHVLIDDEAQEVTYNNATMEVYGVPMLYTPYMSHPTPGADSVSGLLMPAFMHSTNLGSVYKQPVYWAIAPDKDATITPIFTTQEGPVLAGQYRQMFDAGLLEIDGSGTNAQDRNDQGDETVGHEFRGHFDGKGIFRLSEDSDWGFDLHRATDDTYLRRYGFSNETLLTSRLFAEGFNVAGNPRSYAVVQGLSFQGLTGQDSASKIPVVAPLGDFKWESAPMAYDSRVSFDGNAMVLYRKDGPESRRLSSNIAWNLPYITGDGQVIQFTTRLRTDIYDVNDVPLSDGTTFAGITGRVVPEASLLWRYPFISRAGETSFLLEPVVEFALSPGGGNPEKIPNEDSLVPEFTDTNLFSDNRFAGLDRIENGPRMSYGLRGQMQFYSDKYIDWLVGQHYRIDNDPTFPFSNDLTSHFSDYVGKVGVTYNPVYLAYRFRLNKDTLAADRSEIEAGYGDYPFNFYTSYLSLKNDPILQTKEVVTGTAALNLTREWAWNVSGTRDLLLGQTDAAYTGFTFKNECVTLTSMIGKDYTDLLDIKPSLTFWVTLSLKNLD